MEELQSLEPQRVRLFDTDLEEVLVECYRSTELFCRTFLPERFSSEFSPTHREVLELLDDPKVQKLCVIAHRGWGKSTLVLGYALKRIVYRDTNFYILVSKTLVQAERDTEDLKFELMNNERIQAVFQGLAPQSRQDPSGKEYWKTQVARDSDGRIRHYGTLVLPRGSGQQVRGVKLSRFRPDLIICDDLEDSVEVQNDQIRSQTKKWFYSDLLGAVSLREKLTEGEFPHKVVVIGTLLHQDSLLANLSESDDWVTVTAPLCELKPDGSAVSNWTEFMSDNAVVQLYQEYERAGELDVFAREYLCTPVPLGEAEFKQEYFKYYDPEELQGKRLESVVIVDPARVAGGGNSDTAIVGWSFDPVAGVLYLRDLILCQDPPDEVYRKTAEMAVRIGAATIGIEVTGLGSFVTQPFREFLNHWGYSVEFVELKSSNKKGEKDERIRSLLPYYRSGVVRHNRSCSKALELQLLAGPYARKKDAADAASRVVQMLDLGSRTVLPRPDEAELPDPEVPFMVEELSELSLVKRKGWRNLRLHNPYATPYPVGTAVVR